MLKKIFSYLLTDSFNKLLPFLSVFILARYTSPELTGFFSLHVIAYTFFYSIILMGIQARVVIMMTRLNILEKKTITSAYTFCICNYLFYIIIISLFDVYIYIDNTLYSILTCSVFFSIGQIKASTYRVKEKVGSFAIINIYYSLGLFLGVLLKVEIGFSIERIWLLVIPWYMIIGCFLLWKDWDGDYSSLAKELRQYYSFGLGQLGHILSMWGRVAIDRLYVFVVLSAGMLGYYSMVMNISLIVSMFSQSLNNYFSVYLFKCLSKKENKNSILASVYFSIVVLVFSILFLLLSYFFVILYLPVDYSKYYYLIPIIVCAFCFQGFYLSIVNYIFYIEKTYLLNIPSLTSTFLMLVINYFLIDWLGVVGAPISLLISWAVQFILVLVIVFRYKDEIFK
ncbi:hypothetical protein FCV50_05625 [Vibrio kanaloae]|uniref:Polysaccharide biosynthesis protein C-terminal domain-containing protein n=1 Tax=Vibrio kanaloae TaxID=170673 RepID=A0A4U1ZHW2_9VIBR|nr:hypothetical protein [Vibrio kanaloae]TKF34100.1 hypothetical protein FCV50_05625 [Vibrio kanaloae]